VGLYTIHVLCRCTAWATANVEIVLLTVPAIALAVWGARRFSTWRL
jgi:hypothetical protein